MISLEPKRDNIIARLIEIQKTESGLHLPDSEQIKGQSVFAYVERVGPDVKSCKPGDVVVPLVVGQCWLKGGSYRRAIIKDENVLAIVHDLDTKTIRYLDENNGGSRIAMPAT